MHLEAVPNIHAAAFLGRTPWDVFRDPLLLADAHTTAWRCYGQRIVSPLLIPHLAEAEAWGAELQPEEDGETIVCKRPPLDHWEQLADLPPLDPQATSLAMILKAATQIAQEAPAQTVVPITGPVAIASMLVGENVVIQQAHTRPKSFVAGLHSIVEALGPWIAAIGSRHLGASIYEADYEPSKIAPDAYARVVLPSLQDLVEEVRRVTHRPPALFVDGDTAAIAAGLCGTGAGYIACPDTTAQSALMSLIRKYRDVTVRVDLPRDLWVGSSWQAVCREISARTALARIHEQTVLGTGPLPLRASSILVVDARNFANNMDPWVDDT